MNNPEISFFLYGDVGGKHTFLTVEHKDDNGNNIMTIMYGDYVLAETNETDKYYFFRKDNGVIDCANSLPCDVFQNYICLKGMQGELDPSLIGDIDYKLSDDKKVMTITTYVKEEKKTCSKIFQRVKSLLGKNK
jgi:hypothetical protein